MFSLPLEMGRTATDFGGHLIANSKVAVFPRSLIFQGTDSRCNLYSVTTGWMLFSVCFLLGKDYEDHGTTFLCQTEESATL